MKTDSGIYQRAFFAIVLLTLIAISFMIIKPFLTAVLTGIILSYIFYPVYIKIKKRIVSKNISALITCVLVILIITMPLFFVLNTLSKEAYATYILTRQKLASSEPFNVECTEDKFSCRIANYFEDKVTNPQIRYYVDTTIKGATTRITDNISNTLLTIPLFVLHLFIALFVMFFLLRDGKIVVKKVEKLMPLKEKYRLLVIKRLNEMTYAVIYGSLIIAIIQGTLGGIGFFIFGVPAPLLWGMVMIFAALIPYIGSSVIWLPAALLLIFNGYVDLDTGLIIRGVLLMIYGVFVVGTIDNILKPKIIGDKGGLHPILVLLGVVGGLSLFGFIGVLVGPILLAILITFMNIYEEEKD